MKLKLIFYLLVMTFYLSAQTAAEGEALFNSKQYAKARAVYEALHKQRPNDPLYNYRLARCHYELKNYEAAITHFQMAGTRYPARDLYLGESYFNTYRFDESVMAYNTYIATLKPNDPKIAELQQKVAKSEIGAKLINKVEDIAIVDSVVVSKTDFLKHYKSGTEIGSLSLEPLKLNARKNTEKVKFTTQRKDRVYFSDSIHGHMDLFTSYRLLDTWSEPIPVSDIINTPANENYPFLLLDGVTIYYASDGANSLGGYDIFISRYTPSSNTYLTPENIGMPFNSPYNDYMMVIDEQRKLGWFATDRYQPAGKVVIYTFVPNDMRTIIRTEDKDYLRNVARLKTYRKADATLPNNTTVSTGQLQDSEKRIDFIVNDTTVYTHVSQFKSPVAIEQWSELHKMGQDLKAKKARLEDMQIRYPNAETADERKNLGDSILELEKSVIELKKNIVIKTNEVRNEEIKFLQNRQ